MTTPDNIANISLEDQRILKEQLERTIKAIGQFFSADRIEQVARETKFVERESKLTGLLFISIFVFGVSIYGNPTLEQLLGLLATHLENCNLTRSGLHQRITAQAITFFERILADALAYTIPDRLALKLPTQFTGIKIWDSTTFQLPQALATAFPGQGGSASPAGAKIQFGYDFTHHHWWYALHAATANDHSVQSEIVARAQAGNLILHDLGYTDVTMFAALTAKGAYYLSRIKQNTNIYQQDGTGALVAESLPTLLRRHLFTERMELDVWLRSQHDTFTATRLIVERLPDSVLNQRLRKLHREARSRNRQLTADTIFLASFNFYVTNAQSALLPAACCHWLYSLRWQIELVFKSWKQHLQIHQVRVKHRPERVQVTVFGKLIFVTLSAHLIRPATTWLWLTSRLEISYYRALRHIQTIAERWLELVLRSNFDEIFSVLTNAISFIQQHSFKISQHDRIYPLEKLQLFEELVVTS